MRVRSTGLGKTEMVAYPEFIKQKDGHLILSIRSTEPVSWHIRIALNFKDIRMMVKEALVFSTVWYIISSFLRRKEPTPPLDF